MKKQPIAFATSLRTIRTEAGLSVSALAAASGISPSYVCDLESGRRKPSLALASKLAKALRVSLAVFDESTE